MRVLLAFAILFQAASPGLRAVEPDLDRDGIDDHLESALLAKFLPRFRIAAADCDGRPSEFRPDAPHPAGPQRNGTIYGQVSHYPGDGGGRQLELHYYHLWARDCGAAGHDLDAEHVTVLVAADQPAAPADSWTARYWYAAAHEDTICDASSFARADTLRAEAHGAVVWVSEGKHASFFSETSCSRGCGADRCAGTRELEVPKVVNLGERHAPMECCSWIHSGRWPLEAKLGSDFTRDQLTLLDGPVGAGIAFVPRNKAQQAIVRAGSSTGAALERGRKETAGGMDDASSQATGNALRTGMERTTDALETSVRSFRKSFQSVRRKITF